MQVGICTRIEMTDKRDIVGVMRIMDYTNQDTVPGEDHGQGRDQCQDPGIKLFIDDSSIGRAPNDTNF